MNPVVPLLLALGASPTAIAQDAPAPVTLDVVVEDVKGRQPRILSASDVSVTEQGIPLTVSAVRPVHETKRVIGFFLDEFHVAPGAAAARVRDALVRFVRDDLQ